MEVWHQETEFPVAHDPFLKKEIKKETSTKFRLKKRPWVSIRDIYHPKKSNTVFKRVKQLAYKISIYLFCQNIGHFTSIPQNDKY